MNKKIMSIAGLIFAIIFVAVFIIVWSTSQTIIKGEANQLNEMYYTEVPFDTNLFDDKAVTGRTIINLAEDLAQTGFTRSSKLHFYMGDKSQNPQDFNQIGSDSDYEYYDTFVDNILKPSITKDKEYRVFIHTGLNGSIDGIAIQEN